MWKINYLLLMNPSPDPLVSIPDLPVPDFLHPNPVPSLPIYLDPDRVSEQYERDKTYQDEQNKERTRNQFIANFNAALQDDNIWRYGGANSHTGIFRSNDNASVYIDTVDVDEKTIYNCISRAPKWNVIQTLYNGRRAVKISRIRLLDDHKIQGKTNREKLIGDSSTIKPYSADIGTIRDRLGELADLLSDHISKYNEDQKTQKEIDEDNTKRIMKTINKPRWLCWPWK